MTRARFDDLDKIRVEGLRVDCIVGILPEERTREQPLRVDLELRTDTREAGHSGRISQTVDYDRVSREVAHLLRFRRYRLLEMAAHELCAMLLGVHPTVAQVRLRLTKPHALIGRAEGASVEIVRQAEDFPRGFEDNDFGQVEILYESREAGLYLLHVDPGRGIPSHYHAQMRELEWCVAGSLERDGVALRDLAPVAWPHGRVHRYDNPSDERATLFCCDVPPFIREDEIVVDPNAPSAAAPAASSEGSS